MQELREIVKKRLEQRRNEAAALGDRRDWDGSTAADAAVSELGWVLDQIESTPGGNVTVDSTRVFKESVTFTEDATFDKDVHVGGKLVVMGAFSTNGFKT